MNSFPAKVAEMNMVREYTSQIADQNTLDPLLPGDVSGILHQPTK